MNTWATGTYTRRAIANYVLPVLGFLAVVVPFIALVSVIGWGVMRWSDGVYAGYHYRDARRAALEVLDSQYGRDTVSGMRFADPPAIRAHSQSVQFQETGGQVRVFHLYGHQGVRYCVQVQTAGQGSRVKVKNMWVGASSFAVQKGCTFSKKAIR